MESIVIPNIVLACHLAVIAWVDFRRLVIPDVLNLSLAICGFAVSVAVQDKTAMNVVLESGVTVGLFLLIGKIYSVSRARQGIGLGDVKFLGAASIWVGLLGIPWIILIASISGLMFVVSASVSGRVVSAESRIAFGPHLSLGLMMVWLLKDEIGFHA